MKARCLVTDNIVIQYHGHQMASSVKLSEM